MVTKLVSLIQHLLMTLVVGLVTLIVVGKYFSTPDLFLAITNKYKEISYIKEIGKVEVASDSTAMTRSVPVLTYHGIVEHYDGTNVTEDNFKDQMFALKVAGWRTISFEEFFKYMQGDLEIPKNSFLLTFDDGQKLSYYPVDPILKALGYRAVNFVISKHSLGRGSSYYLSKQELLKMLDSNRWEVQAHAKNSHDLIEIDVDGNKGHFLSNKMWLRDSKRIETDEEFENRIINEFSQTKQEIEEALNVKVIGYAYPFGDFGQGTINYYGAKEVIAKATKKIFPLYQAYQVWEGGGYTYNHSDPEKEDYLVKRISVKPEWTATELIKILENGADKQLPYSDGFALNNGWKEVSAVLSYLDGTLILAPRQGGNAMIFLDGSGLWENYYYNLFVEQYKGDTISLVARYNDNNNYIQCDFKSSEVVIRIRENGIEKTIKEKRLNTKLSSKYLGVQVKDESIGCYIDKKIVVSAVLSGGSYPSGGIGLKIWSSIPGDVSLGVKDLVVEQIHD